MANRGKPHIDGVPKLVFDILSGTLLAGATAPLSMVTAVQCAIDTRTARPLLLQPRYVGKGDAKMRVPKWLTIARALTADSDCPQTVSGEIDERATPTGNKVRKGRRDELPQAFLVAAGKLSMVGPRPPVEKTLEYHKSDNPWLAAICIPELMFTKAGLFSYSAAYRIGKPNTSEIRQVSNALDKIYYETADFKVDSDVVYQSARAIYSGGKATSTQLAGLENLGRHMIADESNFRYVVDELADQDPADLVAALRLGVDAPSELFMPLSPSVEVEPGI